MKRHEALRAVSVQAADQWGLVTTAQAKLAGLTSVDLRRLAEVHLVEGVGRGVYLVAGATPPEHLEIKVAWLRLDPTRPTWKRLQPETYGGVVSHGSACELHRLGDIPTSEVEISVPTRRVTREPGVRLHRAAIEASDVTIVDGLPVTTAERTVVDLLEARADGGHVGGVIADAIRFGLVDRENLADRAAYFSSAYGFPRSASGVQFLSYLLKQSGATLFVDEMEIRAAIERIVGGGDLFALREDLSRMVRTSGEPYEATAEPEGKRTKTSFRMRRRRVTEKSKPSSKKMSAESQRDIPPEDRS
ncbi:type IV toxin-antitoxin system AbiEi family antitoxin domain-containing protein [Acrocarpospora catenulata]|uniref:type IV toxin-antitoxin system AbiEi family antitoxin domain-containing protein n=1 Tax=Acrocarpospora catenulata TaxID=2836182 RepID=UPI001BDA543F|nr:type IV toxin-antitoxin system AbiEi family antitoxin domain-containing protein [Acrocarpospora catenulata]